MYANGAGAGGSSSSTGVSWVGASTCIALSVWVLVVCFANRGSLLKNPTISASVDSMLLRRVSTERC